MQNKFDLPTATMAETHSNRGRVSNEPLFLDIVEVFKGKDGVQITALEKLLHVKLQSIRVYARKHKIKYQIRQKGNTKYIFFI
ncbi:MAG: hypothetical protein ACTSQE_14800 [Candidatus Heimdallarchaeaceae archaeon]